MAVALDDSGGSGTSSPTSPPLTTIAGVHLSGIPVLGAVLAGVELSLDLGQIAEINGHLDEAEGFLADARAKLAAIPPAAVGGSPVGQQLAHHSALANEALHTTLQNMETGVLYYRDMIKAAVAAITDADQTSESMMKVQGGDCFTPQPSSSVPSCTPGGA